MIPETLLPFKAHPLVHGGDLQTIIGYYLPADNTVSTPKLHTMDLPDGDQLVLCENAFGRKALTRKAVLLMHGLGGDSRSPYMLRMTNLFCNRGWTTFRMNHRGCGEGTGLARKTYHSGKSDDVSAVMQKIEELYPETPFIAIGFSLSGNALLKLLGENQFLVPKTLVGAVSVSAPIKLSLSADKICRLRNRIYDFRFVKMVKEAVRQREHKFPDFPTISFPRNMTIRKFDEVCTAPLHGFASAEEYYTKCSAAQFLKDISVPTIMLASDDDPCVPLTCYENLSLSNNVEKIITRSGGHMGFVSAQKTPLDTVRWMDYAMMTFSEHFLKSTITSEQTTV